MSVRGRRSAARKPLPRHDRPTFAELAAQDDSLAWTSNPKNQMVQHPPLYYRDWQRALFWRHQPPLEGFLVLGTARCTSTGSCRYFCAFRSHCSRRPAALRDGLVPWGGRDRGRVHTSRTDADFHRAGGREQQRAADTSGRSWTIGRAVAYVNGRDRRWAYVAAAAAAAATLTEKSTAALLSPWVALVVCLTAWRRRDAENPADKPVRTLVVTLAILAIGSWWHTMNLIRFHDAQPGGGLRRTGLPTHLADFLPAWGSASHHVVLGSTRLDPRA